MHIHHVFLHRLQTSKDDPTFSARIFPLCSSMCFISMTDQQSPSNAGMSTDITNVLGLTDVHYIHVMLQIIFVDEEVAADFTRNVSSFCCNLVDDSHVFIIVECTEVLVTELAKFSDMRSPKVFPNFGNV